MKSIEIEITKKYIYVVNNLQNNEAWDIVNRQDHAIKWGEEIEQQESPTEMETTWIEARYINEEE